jgi:hypothetical protein
VTRGLFLGLGALALLALFGRKGSAAVDQGGEAPPPEEIIEATGPGGRMTLDQVTELAQRLCGDYFPAIDPAMVIAICWIESHFDPNAHNPRDPSTGIMQCTPATAAEMQGRGYTAYAFEGEQSLYDAETCIYFGTAYLQWLSERPGAQTAGEEFIVRGYNGGPRGIQKSATQPYWAKYQNARAALGI